MRNSTTIDGNVGQRIRRARIAAAVVGATAVVWLTGVDAQEMSNGELAATIRASGNPCQRVIEKERTSDSSSVWRVKCNSGHFQVTIKGDSNAEVVRLD